MWQALGALLPIAVAVAFSSVPLTVTILILLSPNRGRAALPFLVGWVIGVAAVISLSAAGAAILSQPLRRRQDTAIAILEILIGSALIVLAAVYLRRRSQTSRGLPRWLAAVDSFGLTRPGADGRIAAPEAIAAAPKGRLIQNAHRQPSPSVSHPPRTGPSIADSANTAPTTLMEAARSRAGMTSAMMA